MRSGLLVVPIVLAIFASACSGNDDPEAVTSTDAQPVDCLSRRIPATSGGDAQVLFAKQIIPRGTLVSEITATATKYLSAVRLPSVDVCETALREVFVLDRDFRGLVVAEDIAAELIIDAGHFVSPEDFDG